ncbi:HepT-like ribonuclease domain-containing protein [Fulvimarina sp. 2208YS6-2-32]|uniref:HepT-like ribonuclease domain-containing protein n=1 Tax=Fulvimarina uroteuthidis TaxID=3098149 RepID=A0ABU5I6H2_9HYPH|nr:HepT-like ribonuclease domain-containing protein [Fulvimarina sp. 2208YS6-2-32]MDY8110987.1 HepT-like ribonuclease domain-containing protein [Fulvimarina sp. 2208YS6-2-32]
MSALPDDIVDLLIAIRRWCDDVEALLDGERDALFQESRVHELALSKSIEQVGEFCGRLLRKHPEFADLHPELELRPASAMRNRLVHGYDDVVISVVIATGRRDIPVLKKAVDAILQDAGEDVP